MTVESQPVEEQIVCVGKSATLNITTQGTPDQCTWQFLAQSCAKPGQETWSDVTGARFEGADTTVLRVLDVQTSDRGLYRCTVQKGKESLISNPCDLRVGKLFYHWQASYEVLSVIIVGSGR